jgi:type I restriction enzyme, S subunit
VKVTSRWPAVPLGDLVADTQYGTSVRANEEGVGVPVLRMGNITYSGALDLTDLKHVELPAKDLEQYSVRRGDLLFNRTNSQELVGKMGVWNRDEPYAFAGYLVRLRLNRDLADPAFVAAWFNTTEMKTLLRTRAKPSINMSNINATEVLRFCVVHPPLTEQRRIVEVLDRAEALRAKRRAAIAQLDTLPQLIFFDLFGEPIANSKKWRRAPFGELLAKIDSGWSPICLGRPAEANEWGVLKLGAVTWCEYDAAENKALPADVEPDTDLEVMPGDLLFARKNTHELVAACALVRSTPPRLMMSDLIFRFRLRSDANVDPCFLHQLLIYPTKRRDIQKLAGGSAGSMPNISKARLQTVPIEVPPLELQQDFARRIVAVEKLKAAHRASLAELDALFAALQHRAFRGEL